MRSLIALIRRPRRGLRGQGGFTLISSVVGMIVGGTVLTGAWLAYANMQTQMHILAADRQMDQYAHSAFQELTNVCSWSWAGEELQGGAQHTRWKFLTEDVVKEFGTRLKYQPDQNGFITLKYQASRGILVNDQPPSWMVDQHRNFYVFDGRPSGPLQVKMMDRRDRMTIEGMTLDFGQSRFDTTAMGSQSGTVSVGMTLQYRYQPRSMFGMYPRTYVHERNYATQIYMRNWDSDLNAYRRAKQASNG